MEDIDDSDKISSLIVKFIEFNRIDIRLEIAYILTFQLTDDQKKKITDYKEVREYCKKLLTDEPFLRSMKRRLSVTEETESVRYWDKIMDKFDDTYNYDEGLEIKIIDINMYLNEFIARLLRELEIQNLEFTLG